MNDTEYWVSHMDLKDTYDFYLKDCGLDTDDNPISEVKECDMDNERMCLLIDNDYEFINHIKNGDIQENTIE